MRNAQMKTLAPVAVTIGTDSQLGDYQDLVASGELEWHLVPQAPKEFRFWAVIFGTLALVVGFSLVLFILWSMVFGYR